VFPRQVQMYRAIPISRVPGQLLAHQHPVEGFARVMQSQQRLALIVVQQRPDQTHEAGHAGTAAEHDYRIVPVVPHAARRPAHLDDVVHGHFQQPPGEPSAGVGLDQDVERAIAVAHGHRRVRSAEAVGQPDMNVLSVLDRQSADGRRGGRERVRVYVVDERPRGHNPVRPVRGRRQQVAPQPITLAGLAPTSPPRALSVVHVEHAVRASRTAAVRLGGRFRRRVVHGCRGGG